MYYCPFNGDRVVLPVNECGNPILPPPTKQLRVRPDGGMGPIPLHTGWTLGQVPQHIAAWAHASQRAAQAGHDPHTDVSSSLGVSGARSRSGTETAASFAGLGSGGGVVFGPTPQGRDGDPVLRSIGAGMPGLKLPLVPDTDETFVSRDTGVTGKPGMSLLLVWGVASVFGFHGRSDGVHMVFCRCRQTQLSSVYWTHIS